MFAACRVSCVHSVLASVGLPAFFSRDIAQPRGELRELDPYINNNGCLLVRLDRHGIPSQVLELKISPAPRTAYQLALLMHFPASLTKRTLHYLSCYRNAQSTLEGAPRTPL
jgi:hypothetical protein